MKIIIYGANETSLLIAQEFYKNHDVIVVDENKQKLVEFSNLDIATIVGNAACTDILEEAAIKSCNLFISSTQNDELNIVACIMAKAMSDTRTVCFVSNKEYLKSLKTMKDEVCRKNELIDYIIWPEKLLTHEIYQIVTVPDAIDVENFAQDEAKLLEYRIKENSYLENKMIKDCQIPENALIVGVVRDDELSIPTGATQLKLNDKVIFMGTQESLDVSIAKIFDKANSITNVAIIGGGSVGFELAKSLEKTSINVKIIEKDYERCQFLAQNLSSALVLHGNGADNNLLAQESINETDAVICVTNSDEKNLLCSLLTKQMGVKRVITRVSQNSTANLFEKVGVDIAISTKEAVVNEIKNKIIEAKNNILATVEGGLGEIIEIDISQSYIDKMVMELKLPAHAVIAIIKRNRKIIIPKGKTLIRANDTLIVFTKAQDVGKIRGYFEK